MPGVGGGNQPQTEPPSRGKEYQEVTCGPVLELLVPPGAQVQEQNVLPTQGLAHGEKQAVLPEKPVTARGRWLWGRQKLNPACWSMNIPG